MWMGKEWDNWVTWVIVIGVIHLLTMPPDLTSTVET